MKPPKQTYRWSNDQRTWGPFIYSRDKGQMPFGIVLDSGHGENEGCKLRIRGFGHTIIILLPQIIQPYRKKVIAGWDAATVARLGRDWYYDEHAREYGFQFSDEGFLQIFLGAQTNDSTTTQNWCCFLPWTQWRFVRHSFYGLSGEHLRTDLEDGRRGKSMWAQRDERYKFREQMPKAAFEIEDCDGEHIKVKTYIEEREWHFGTGWFKWLSWFRKPMIRRSLDIEFASECGPEKGSWKGGLIGCSIDMLPGELHEAAFRRYCDQEQRERHSRTYRITYIGRIEA